MMCEQYISHWRAAKRQTRRAIIIVIRWVFSNSAAYVRYPEIASHSSAWPDQNRAAVRRRHSIHCNERCVRVWPVFVICSDVTWNLFACNSVALSVTVLYCGTRNLATSDRSRVSCEHKVTTVSRSPKWTSKVTQGHPKYHGSIMPFNNTVLIPFSNSYGLSCIVFHI